MALDSGIAVLGPNMGNRAFILQTGRVTLVAGTITVTVPQAVPAGTVVGELFIKAYKGTTAAAALFPGAVLRTQALAVSAAGVVTFNIVSDDGADTDVVAWESLQPR